MKNSGQAGGVNKKHESDGRKPGEASPPGEKDVEKEANGHPEAEISDDDRKALLAPENVATFRLMQDSTNYSSFDLEKHCESAIETMVKQVYSDCGQSSRLHWRELAPYAAAVQETKSEGPGTSKSLLVVCPV